MHTLPALALALLLALAPQFAARAGGPPAFGSAGLLHGLWSAAELTGPADEAATLRATVPAALPATGSTPGATAAPLPRRLRGSLRSVALAPGDKALALTFDLCEREGEAAGYDAAVVDALRAHRARATFFASGKWLLTHPERAMQLAADPLFELGGHGYAHRNVRLLTTAEQEEEVSRTRAAHARVRKALAARAAARGLSAETMDALPAALRLWRFPYGACNAAALDLLAELGLPAVQWSVVSGDPDPGLNARDMARSVLRQARPGAIVIFHANGRGRHTAEALGAILPELARQGYSLMTVSELLDRGEPRAATECFGEKPGDLDRYDQPGR